MNRAERRRKERNGKKKLTITYEELEKIKMKEREEAFNLVFGCLFTLPFMALRDEGFGRIRLQRVNDRMTDLLKQVEQDEIELNKLVEKMRTEFGIIFRNGESD